MESTKIELEHKLKSVDMDYKKAKWQQRGTDLIAEFSDGVVIGWKIPAELVLLPSEELMLKNVITGEKVELKL